MNIALQKLKDKFSTLTAIADHFGVTQPAITKWYRRNAVPHDRLLDVSSETGLSVDEIVRANLKTENRHV